MKKRRIGQSNLYVSEIGLGCMSIGSDLKKASRIIETAISYGINFLDTADLYEQGWNEEIIGSVIKGKREDLIIATKGGNRFESGKEGWTWDPSKKHIKSAVKESLRRLQIDYIDLYQLHGGTIEDHIGETIEAFEELKQEGLIRYYGLSSIRPNVIAEYLNHSNIVSIMMQYSLLDRRPEELFPLLKKHHISVLARGPLAKGILTGRPANKDYLDYKVEEISSVQTHIKQKLKDHSIHSAALKYCLTSPVIASAVVGASNVQQIIESIQALEDEKPLSESDFAVLMDITKASTYMNHRI